MRRWQHEGSCNHRHSFKILHVSANAYVPEWMYTGWNWILLIRRAWSQWLVWFFTLAAWGTGWAFETSGEAYEDIEE